MQKHTVGEEFMSIPPHFFAYVVFCDCRFIFFLHFSTLSNFLCISVAYIYSQQSSSAVNPKSFIALQGPMGYQEEEEKAIIGTIISSLSTSAREYVAAVHGLMLQGPFVPIPGWRDGFAFGPRKARYQKKPESIDWRWCREAAGTDPDQIHWQNK